MVWSAATVGMLDIGCYSAHLLVIPRRGSLLTPVLKHKTRLHLDRSLDSTGRLDSAGISAIIAAVRKANHIVRKRNFSPVFPFATSAVRDARNAAEIIDIVYQETGTVLHFLSGDKEAELSYRAARSWFGVSMGPLVVIDIGGGTVELAAGHSDYAEFTCSLRLGAREVTRAWLNRDVVSDRDIAAVRAHILERLHVSVSEIASRFPTLHTVGNSAVLRQLSRLTGNPIHRSQAGTVHVDDVRAWIPYLAAMPPSMRATLPGISKPRARQSLAGAVVAEALLTVLGGSASICPWSTPHGLLLSLLDNPEIGI